MISTYSEYHANNKYRAVDKEPQNCAFKYFIWNRAICILRRFSWILIFVHCQISINIEDKMSM